MKKFKRFLSAFLSLIILFSLSSCGEGFSYVDFSAFNSNVHIETYKKDLTEDVLQEIKTLAFDLEKNFDYDGENSLPTLIKNAELNQKIRVTPEHYKITTLALELNEFSDGAFNPLITPLTELWGFKDRILTPSAIPSQSDINEILSSGITDISNLIVENHEISKTKDIFLDFGGILKGYASSKILDLLVEKGYEKGYVNLGGSSLSLTGMPTLNVVHPLKRSESILTVNLEENIISHVSTSGDYENYYEIEGERYCHIIDPSTGCPTKTGVRSATVICSNGGFADGITTALCLKEFNPSSPSTSPLVLLMKKIITKFPSSQIYVVYEKDGEKMLLTNKKQSEDFTLLDNEYKIVNI